MSIERGDPPGWAKESKNVTLVCKFCPFAEEHGFIKKSKRTCPQEEIETCNKEYSSLSINQRRPLTNNGYNLNRDREPVELRRLRDEADQ